MEVLEILEAINTVFASLFYFIGIIAFITVIVVASKIKKKVNQTANMAQDAVFSVHEMFSGIVKNQVSSSIISKIISFFANRR